MERKETVIAGRMLVVVLNERSSKKISPEAKKMCPNEIRTMSTSKMQELDSIHRYREQQSHSMR